MAYVSPATDDTSTDLDTDEKNQMGLPSGRSSASSAASLHQRQPQSDIHSHEYHQLSLLLMLASLTSIFHPLVCLVDTQMAKPEYQAMETGRESKETTPRFVNVSGMAKPQPDASLSFLLPPDAAAEGLHDMILNARDDLDVLSPWSGSLLKQLANKSISGGVAVVLAETNNLDKPEV
ncbi:hypothetical protein ZEAMMB73_Zm00001d020140 [Zea mays]|uniref:Uncharacterized protein n=1 Tax=Zea mays TaxID=4577 RepID=A0A1D6I2B1_MAIZE|nr:hypothetical protein ZEAMMB73_Zm00001d020140 [Zea mays]ONM54332.1 hypothetical protein ZEAMMB73_Zm00001d020140 [Zea mays]